MHTELTEHAQSMSDQAGDQAVLVAGSSRSGTTWVQEIINYRQDHRVIFEPFRPSKVPFLPPQPTPHLYLRPEDPAPHFQPHAMRILRGQLETPWTDDRNHPGIYHHRLIKAIRANLLLRWLVTQMPSLKVVFVLRHPCAVSHSWRRLGWSYDPMPLRQMSSQPALVADFLTPFSSLIEAIDDPFERDILFWAIQNYVPLKQFALHPEDCGQSGKANPYRNQIMLLFYEELCMNPNAELARLFAFLDLPLEPAVYDCWRRPSMTTHRGSAVVTGESMIDAWRHQVTALQSARAISLLQHFGLDQIYNEAAMPCYRSQATQDGQGVSRQPARTQSDVAARNLSPIDIQQERAMVLSTTEASMCTKASFRCINWLNDVAGIRPPCCTARLREILFFVADLLTELGIHHWIDFGTLLGAVRHGSFIPWDEDVDIAFVDSEPSLLPLLAQLCSEAGYAIEYKASIPDELKIHYSETNHNHLDLYAYRRADDGMMRMNWAHNSENWFFPAHFLDTMEPVTLYDRQFLVPSPLHEFLVDYRYGPSYMTPLRTFGIMPYLLAPEEYTPTVATLLQEYQQVTYTNFALKTKVKSCLSADRRSAALALQPNQDRLAYLVRESYTVPPAERQAKWSTFWRSLQETKLLERRVQRKFGAMLSGAEITPAAYLLLDLVAQEKVKRQMLEAVVAV